MSPQIHCYTCFDVFSSISASVCQDLLFNYNSEFKDIFAIAFRLYICEEILKVDIMFEKKRTLFKCSTCVR
jgi:hypothetical protein